MTSHSTCPACSGSLFDLVALEHSADCPTVTFDWTPVHKAQAAVKAAAAKLEAEVKACSCSRCNGTGVVAAYKHHHGGHCFKCDGYKRIETMAYVEAEDKLAAAKAHLAEVEAQLNADYKQASNQ